MDINTLSKCRRLAQSLELVQNNLPEPAKVTARNFINAASVFFGEELQQPRLVLQSFRFLKENYQDLLEEVAFSVAQEANDGM